MARGIIEEGFVSTDEPLAAINVTSLVDVMFCLLIMFMVATPLMSPEGKEVELPVGRGEKISEEQFLTQVISIDAKGNMFLGVLPLSRDPAKLKDEIGKNVTLKDAPRVFIQGDQNVDYSRIVDLLVALKEANVGQVGFVTDPNLQKLREKLTP